MKITSLDKEIRKIFETGYYHIPRFQRPYSWEKEQVSEFWHDTVLESETDYFIGSIVVYKKSDELFGIVDGQQRLTTITMLLCAIRDYYSAEGFENLAKGVHILIEKKDLNNDQQFVLQTETSYPYFQEHIQKFDKPDTETKYGVEEENLKKAYDLINKFIKQELDLIKGNKQLTKENKNQSVQKKLNEIRDKILKLKVIYVELDNEDDAYVIFETLNTRGKDLSVGDLIKNHLTKNIKADNKNVDIPKDKWKTIRDNIDSTSKDLEIDTFLLHVWLSKYEFTTTKTLFKKFKKNISKAEAKKFLDGLVADSVTYKNIFDTETKKWNRNELSLKNSLSILYGFNVTQQTPMVLSIMREYNAKRLKFKLAKEALEAIEHFHYIFTAITSQRSSGGVASMYSQYARKLSEAKDDAGRLAIIRELRQKMKERIPTYDEFLAAFKTLEFTNGYTKQKRIIQYTISKIDKYYNKSGVEINYDSMTLEHLLPQNPPHKLPEHDDFYGTIGNLLMIDEKTNNALGNKTWAAKKNILEKTSVHIDDIIKKATDWTPKEIEKRTISLAKVAYNIVFKI
ncbi:DUF262 domain-containing protein [Foetidibacter luteolus]|uniref:DUF262 domain-containing protein n=1 Tax=Foetidibacter luteolus TaxID=2608880 RepID=UPI00129A58B3|nr:DUF262 domain-containing protein [Foetidibacter luteolus]